MSGARILIVDDDHQIRRLLQNRLKRVDFTPYVASTAKEALEELAARQPDMMLIDLGLPDTNGIVLTREIRSRCAIPIIVVSSETAEAKKVEALDTGADDYITKPFSFPEMHSRIKSVLRRWAKSNGAEASVTIGDLNVNFERREVRIGGEIAHLTPKEYELLKYMIEHAGRALTHKMLLTAVWGPPYVEQAQYLRVFVGQLRKKIEKNRPMQRLIITEPGVGYRFSDQR